MINDTIVDGLTGTDPPSFPDFPQTPYLLLDPKVAATQFHRLAKAFPDTQIFYAVKANPEPKIIRRLAEAGSSFDVASIAEIDICLSIAAVLNRLLQKRPESMAKIGKIDPVLRTFRSGNARLDLSKI